MSNPQIKSPQEREQWFIFSKELQDNKHKHIMEEIKALKDAGVKHFDRGDRV